MVAKLFLLQFRPLWLMILITWMKSLFWLSFVLMRLLTRITLNLISHQLFGVTSEENVEAASSFISNSYPMMDKNARAQIRHPTEPQSQEILSLNCFNLFVDRVSPSSSAPHSPIPRSLPHYDTNDATRNLYLATRRAQNGCTHIAWPIYVARGRGFERLTVFHLALAALDLFSSCNPLSADK